MKNFYIKSVFLSLLLILTHTLLSQINLAPTATMSTNVLGNSAYPLSNMNDNNIVSCNSWTSNGTWFAMSNTTSGEYMDWTWSSAKSINKIRIYHGETSNRFMDAATIEYWTGSAWATWSSFSGLSTSSCDNIITFPTVTTTALRLTNWNIASVGQVSNPCFREIEVISGPSVNIDMGISFLNPLDICSNTQSISVKAFNFGKKTCDSFRLYWSVNGALQSPVRYVTCKLATIKDTSIVLNPSFALTNNTNYSFKFWTSKPNGLLDSIAANDTLFSTLSFLGNPSPPTTVDIKQCGVGPAALTCTPSSSSDIIQWYTQSAGGTLIGVGKTINGPNISKTTTFYAQAVRFGPTLALNNGFSGSSYYGYPYSGGMLDVTPTKLVSLDSITIRPLTNIPGTTMEVYYKVGTYVGSESNAAVWTRIAAGTGRSFISGGINYCRISAGGLNLNANTVYGFYLTTSPTGGTNYALAKPGSVTVSNSYLKIAGGTLIAGLFTSGGGYATNYTIDAEFSSKISCSNPTRSPLTVTVKPRPIGSDVVKGTVYEGQYKQGIPSQPDIVAPGKTVSYQLIPPTGYTNANHGANWIITSVEGRTKYNKIVPTSEYTTTNPSSSGNGTLTFKPSSNLCDSLVTFSIKFQDLGPHFCDSTVTRTIKVAPTPKTNFSFPTPVCDGTDIIFNNLTTVGCGGANNGFANYKWYFGDGDSSDSQNPIHLYKTYGCYSVKLRAISSPWGIIQDTTLTVCVTEVPVVKFKVINACEGQPVKFINQTTIGNGTLVYSWNYGDGSAIGTAANPSHQYVAAGGYKVNLKVSANGCESNATKNAYQFAKPKSNFATAIAPVCANTMIDFPNSTVISLGLEGSFWTYGDGNSSTLADGYNAYNAPGTYSVKLKSVSEFGCMDSITKQVVIKPTPSPNFITNKLCSGEPTNFINTTVETILNPVYTWKFGDNTSYSTTNLTKSWANEGTYNVNLKAEFSNGCSNSINKDIVVLIQPAADFSVKDICSGEIANYVNLTTGDKGNINYFWDLGNGTSTDGAPKRLYTPAVTTTYTITLSASYPSGCSDTMVRAITVSQAPTADFTIQNFGYLKYQFKPVNSTYSQYEWFFGDGGTSTLVSPTYVFAYASGFKVRLITTNAAGCKDDMIKSMSANSAVNALNVAGGINIYPNPNTGIFTINSGGSNGMKIEVFNLLGSKILSQVNSENTVNINLSDVAKGIYLVKVTIDGVTTTTKVTITN